MDKMKDIYERIDGYRDEVIELQRDLCARVALGPLNGGSGEHEKMDFIKELLSGMKPDHMEEIRAPDEKARDGYRPNLIARWKGFGPRGHCSAGKPLPVGM
jgi:succinyl-diaminopimelate desuccinylase